MRSLRRIMCICLAFIGLLTSFLPVFASDINEKTRTIKVGYMNHPGYIEKTENDKMYGCGVEYIEEIVKYTGWTIEYVYASWTEQLRMLENDELDIVPMAQRTPERDEKFLFSSHPIGMIQGLLITLPEGENDITSDPTSFNDKKVGILRGSKNIELFDDYAKHEGFTYELVEYNFQNEIKEALIDKQIDMMACEQIVQTEGLRVIDRFTSDSYYYLTSKTNSELMEEIDYVIGRINAYDPSFSLKLHQKYYGGGLVFDSPLFTTKEKEYIKNNPTVTIALIPDNQPLAFDDENGVTKGIIPDIMNEFTLLCGINFEFVYVPKDITPLKFLQQNPSYFGTGMLSTNPAFQDESVITSDVYYTTYAALIANKQNKNITDYTKGEYTIAIPRSFQAMQLFIKKEYPNLKIVEVLSIKDGLFALEKEEVDFFSYTINLITPYLSNPIYGDLYMVDNKFLPCPLCSIGINQENSDNQIMIDILDKCTSYITNTDISRIELEYVRSGLYRFNDNDVLKRYQTIIILIAAVVTSIISLFLLTLFLRQRKYNRNLALRAEYDLITGLYNRSTMKSKVIEMLRNSEGKDCSFLLIDIDDMKVINDTKGHEIGDEVIKAVANIIRNQFGGSALLGRIGGDDFAILLVGIESKSILVSLLSRLQRTVSVTAVSDSLVSISISVGVSMFKAGDHTIDEIFRRSDESLTYVKNNGKNGFCFYSSNKTVSHKAVIQSHDNLSSVVVDDDQVVIDYKKPDVIDYVDSDFKDLLESFPNIAVYVIEQKTHRVLYYNKRFREICPKVSIGMNCRGLMFGPCDHCLVDTMREQNMAHSVYFSEVYGDEIEITAIRIMWKKKVPAILISSWPRNAITSSSDQVHNLKNHNSFDFVTGGYSRQGFIGMLERMRHGGVDLTEYAILFVNVQDFKAVNEMIGNDGGDNLLHTILKRIEGSDLHPVVCARKESDHFIFMVEKKTLDMKVLSSLLNFHYSYKGKDLFILCRCGIFMIDDASLEVYKMIDRAKLAKDHIVDEYVKPYSIFEPSMLEEYSEKAKAFLLFDQGIKNNEFVVFFQPVYEPVNGKIVSAEALVRRKLPDGSIVSPAKFIPVFERTGYISMLDKYICEQVCAFQKKRIKDNLPIVPISFNLSQMDFYDTAFIEGLVNDFENKVIPENTIMVEITESAYSLSEKNNELFLKRLRDCGAKILLDDFGTGYSSFGMFKYYNFDRIKLDMSFVRQLTDNPNVKQVVETIISMCHKLNIQVVAEGVENELELSILRDMNCDLIQGYYYSKPLDSKSFSELLKKNT